MFIVHSFALSLSFALVYVSSNTCAALHLFGMGREMTQTIRKARADELQLQREQKQRHKSMSLIHLLAGRVGSDSIRPRRPDEEEQEEW
uniref:Secreted protein n=1 Tax=Nelumbo nucifera TaxID=4432 RepID=A0A822YTM3_NELNU|nr:TPA_asm: hypothetical protein HUJ06_008105 [Nelumbo nucifera]